MTDVFFPSCNFTKASPAAAQRILDYMAERMLVAGCCRTTQLWRIPACRAIYFCQACREVLEERASRRFTTENLFVYLNGLEDYPWPDYSGLTATVQDCWRDRDHPEIFDAVRTALGHMRVNVIEQVKSRERTAFCGDLHFEPESEENLALLAANAGTPIYALPTAQKAALMAEHVASLPCGLAITYCNRCTAGIKLGGGNAVHLLELVTGIYAPQTSI